MWGLFLLSALMLATVLYIPAALALRSFGARRAVAVCAAPLVSASMISVLPVFYDIVGVRSSCLTVVAPLLVLAIVGIAVGLTRRGLKSYFFDDEKPVLPIAFILCLVIGIATSMLMYVVPLGQPAAFVQGNDIAHHLNQAKAFLESGNWSMLNGTLDPSELGAYYPSMWAIFTTFLSNATGASVMLSANVVNALVAGLIFPTSMYLFASVVFCGRRRMVLLCCVGSMIFFGMPWQLFMRSALLYPNALGMALLPSAAAIVIMAANSCFEEGESAKKRAGLSLLAVLGIACLGLAHPNTVFSLYVLLAPFGAWRIASGLAKRGFSRIKRFAFVAVYLVLVVVFWLAMTQVSFFQSIVAYPYGKSAGILESFLANLAFKTSYAGAQYVLGVVVLIGFAIACWKKECRWMACSYAVVFILCTVNACLPDCDVKHLISGFWYNHPVRLAAMKALFAVPLAALGLEFVMTLALRLFERAAKMGKLGLPTVQAAVLSILLVLIAVIPLPFPHAGTFQGYARNMIDYNSPNGSKSFLVQDEQDFLKEVRQIVNPEKKILNVAHDGSAFAYALDGLNITSRSFYSGGTVETDLRLLDTEIDKIGSSEVVRDAVNRLNVGYILVLDRPGQKGATIYSNRFDDSDWSGIYSVSEKDSNFDLLLSKGDMKLYGIVA